MQMFQVPAKTLNMIVGILTKLPYENVSPVIKEIESTVKPIEEPETNTVTLVSA